MRIGRVFGKPSSSIFKHIRSTGGFTPVERKRAPSALTLAEREEISRGLVAGQTVRAIAAWLDTQDAVDTACGIGAVGFCMTGSWTLRAAAAVPDRIKAPTSFHGGGLVTDADDSPHRLAGQIKGGVLIAIAENDHEKEPEAQGELMAAFSAVGVPAEIEVYDDAMHGWVPTDSRAHNPDQSARAWARMLALFERELAG